MIFSFWPQGHPAIPSVNFPEYLTPHMEAYTSTGKFDGFADAKGAQSFSKTCKQARDLPARWAGKKRATITTTMQVNCAFPAVAEMKATKVRSGSLFTVTLGHSSKLVLSASIKTAGSTLTYDTRYCRTTPAPAPPKPAMYTFSGLTASFDAHGVHGTYTFSGQVCGDPGSTPWSVTFAFLTSGPFKQSVVLQPGTPTPVAAYIAKDSSGAELAKITLKLTFMPGPPPQVALSADQSGDVSNVQLGPPAAVTVTPVASCP